MQGENFHHKKDKLYESKHNIYDQTERQKKESCEEEPQTQAISNKRGNYEKNEAIRRRHQMGEKSLK